MKICRKCKIHKPLDAFYKDKKDKIFGVTSWCKECSKENSKYFYRTSENYRQSIRDGGLKSRFGISRDDYYRMLEDQGGVCAICKKKPEQYLHVDHCHQSKEMNIRGLLCKTCNNGLGNFKDNQEFLRSAIEYLDRNSVRK